MVQIVQKPAAPRKMFRSPQGERGATSPDAACRKKKVYVLAFRLLYHRLRKMGILSERHFSCEYAQTGKPDEREMLHAESILRRIHPLLRM